MERSVGKSADVQAVEINNNVKEVLLYKRKKISLVIAKKANVLKNTANVTLMELNVAKLATVWIAKTFEDVFLYFLLLVIKICLKFTKYII